MLGSQGLMLVMYVVMSLIRLGLPSAAKAGEDARPVQQIGTGVRREELAARLSKLEGKLVSGGGRKGKVPMLAHVICTF